MIHRFAVAVLGLAACGVAALAQPTGLPPVPRVTDVRLYVLDCGTIISHEPERFGLTRQDVPDPDFADPCFLVVHPRGTLLFDTGLPDAQVGRPIYENKMGYEGILKTVSLKGQLANIGVTAPMITYLAISHSHWDHVEALPKFRTTFPNAQLHSTSKSAPTSQRNQPDEIIQLGSLRIAHRETPGHAEDGVTYLISGWPDTTTQVAIVGDTILAGSMCNGNGQWALAKEKIYEHILPLPADTLLCPGHGPVTTVAQEKVHNPFF
jgi:glyoxylase-like metal-dependent hydrolase (beta-lactamase superfamily II)